MKALLIKEMDKCPHLILDPDALKGARVKMNQQSTTTLAGEFNLVSFNPPSPPPASKVAGLDPSPGSQLSTHANDGDAHHAVGLAQVTPNGVYDDEPDFDAFEDPDSSVPQVIGVARERDAAGAGGGVKSSPLHSLFDFPSAQATIAADYHKYKHLHLHKVPEPFMKLMKAYHEYKNAGPVPLTSGAMFTQAQENKKTLTSRGNSPHADNGSRGPPYVVAMQKTGMKSPKPSLTTLKDSVATGNNAGNMLMLQLQLQHSNASAPGSSSSSDAGRRSSSKFSLRTLEDSTGKSPGIKVPQSLHSTPSVPPCSSSSSDAKRSQSEVTGMTSSPDGDGMSGRDQDKRKRVRFAVTDEAVAHLAALKALPHDVNTCLAQLESSLSEKGTEHGILVDGKWERVTYADVQSLHPRGWITCNIIDFYFNMLHARDEHLSTVDSSRKRSHFHNCNFFGHYLSNGYEGVRNWTQHVNIFDMDKVFIPVNRHDPVPHWAMVIIYVRKREIHYNDSLPNSGTVYLNAALHWLQGEASCRRVDFDSTKWTLMDSLNSTRALPQQDNGYDCGIFAIMNAHFAFHDLPFVYAQDDLPLLRQRVGLSIARKEVTVPHSF